MIAEDSTITQERQKLFSTGTLTEKRLLSYFRSRSLENCRWLTGYLSHVEITVFRLEESKTECLRCRIKFRTFQSQKLRTDIRNFTDLRYAFAWSYSTGEKLKTGGKDAPGRMKSLHGVLSRLLSTYEQGKGPMIWYNVPKMQIRLALSKKEHQDRLQKLRS